MSVCRVWKEVVENTPTLWSNLCITDIDARYFVTQIHHLPFLLVRSGACLLNVSIHSTGRKETHQNTPRKAEEYVFWSHLLREISRFETLSIDLPHEDHPILRLLVSSANSLTQLKHLKIAIRQVSSPQNEFTCDLHSFQNIRTLILFLPTAPKWKLRNTWPFLTFLRVDSKTFTGRDIPMILLAAPRLRYLTADISATEIEESAMIHTPIIHHSLIQLSLEQSGHISPIATSVSLPALEKLSIKQNGREGYGRTIPFVITVQEWSWPSLTTVDIWASGIPSRYLLSLLKASPCLENLNIEGTMNPPDVWQPIVVHNRLKNLTVKLFKKHIPTTFFQLMALPSLTHLDIRHVSLPLSAQQEDDCHFFYFFMRSRPRLESFILEDLDLTKKHLIAILAKCPVLTYLEISKERSSDLVNVFTSSSKLSRSLSTLRLLGQITSVDGDAGRMAKARYALGNLRRFQIEFDRNPHPVDELAFQDLRRKGLNIKWAPSTKLNWTTPNDVK